MHEENIEKTIDEIEVMMSDPSRTNALFRPAMRGALRGMIEVGRLSVLQDFDNMCIADAFVGFTDAEWQAVKKFFAFNKKISNWDK